MHDSDSGNRGGGGGGAGRGSRADFPSSAAGMKRDRAAAWEPPQQQQQGQRAAPGSVQSGSTATLAGGRSTRFGAERTPASLGTPASVVLLDDEGVYSQLRVPLEETGAPQQQQRGRRSVSVSVTSRVRQAWGEGEEGGGPGGAASASAWEALEEAGGGGGDAAAQRRRQLLAREEGDADFDRSFYDADEGLAPPDAADPSAGGLIVENEKTAAMESRVEAARSRGETKLRGMSARKSALHADQQAWESNRLRTSGVMEGSGGGGEEEEEEARVHLLVHNIRPPFLEGAGAQLQLAQQGAMVRTVRDPTSDMAQLATRGSAVLRRSRETRDRAKVRTGGGGFGGPQRCRKGEGWLRGLASSLPRPSRAGDEPAAVLGARGLPHGRRTGHRSPRRPRRCRGRRGGRSRAGAPRRGPRRSSRGGGSR